MCRSVAARQQHVSKCGKWGIISCSQNDDGGAVGAHPTAADTHSFYSRGLMSKLT